MDFDKFLSQGNGDGEQIRNNPMNWFQAATNNASNLTSLFLIYIFTILYYL
jgi:hypothetical protein